ncbi:PGAP1-like protein [Bernardetia litoralis DSM 6794]|uniref:PGAP1-like protein n=1 Tax=Bernardetia litoralis (strain ATCC 23117 / DSM 6794 / NBRC 15988 / NCIMB 1366 / Fx l1 / Sio-4) TaxID=880071 RepID=I4AG02_BERLS|nr:T9SS type A sorting domain-containing protein [Bernardetia litoralis]AFM02887.1 PGAP1-like protein [Bernardetia litoralis DSM 6794]
MNRIFQSVVAFFVCLLFSFGAVAQQIQETNLVTPTQMTSIAGDILGSGESDAGNIYYGATPSNLRAGSPVIVFIHGYSSRASTWWEDNDMYSKAYADGYRTAFVSVHPDKDMWVNGELFNTMLGTITNHFSVNKVVVVAHSKGGLDTDAALVHYGATSKVERAITLSSPHHGTPLADLAQSGWVSWLSGVFGQVNDATNSLQTGYASYFRSQTASHSNYSNANFRTVGAWGYGGILWTPGIYLSWNGGSSWSGGNDGVVTYKSSKRPNSTTLLSGHGNSTTDLDHSEVHEGKYMWNTVKNNLPYSLSKVSSKPIETETLTNPNAVVESRVQVLSSEKTSRNFMVEEGVTATMLDIHHLEANEDFVIIAPNGEKVSPKVLRVSEKANDLLGGFATTLSIENPQMGTYSIESQSPFVALVTANEGVSLRMTSDLNDNKYYYNVGETINLNISILNELGINTKGAKVTGAMTLTSNDVKSQKAVVLEFKQNNGQFTATVNDKLAEGIYSIAIQAENGNFSKSLVTSIAVVDGVLHTLADNDTKNNINENSVESIKLMPTFPNPFSTQTTVSFELKNSSPAVLTIYDAVGRVVETVDLASYGIGTHQYTWNVNQNKVKNGLYIAEIRNGNERVTQTMVYSK